MQIARLLIATIAAVVGTALPSVAIEPADRVEPGDPPRPTALTLLAGKGYADRPVPLTVALSAAGAPIMGAPVLVERRRDRVWSEVAVLVTDEYGAARTSVKRARVARDNVFRASYAGDETHASAATGPVTSTLVRRSSRVSLSGPQRLVDGRSATLTVRWRTGSGQPVVGGTIRVLSRPGTGGWRLFRSLRADRTGHASVRVSPHTDTRWRAVVRGQDWVEPARSAVLRVAIRPPGRPVSYPRAAPRPRVHVPRQPRVLGTGPHAVVRPIPDPVWRQMTGRSWHPGCPVGRAGLRLLRVNYWGYDGYRYRGELVAATGAVDNMARALSDMYRARLPIRSMYRVDRFGWSPTLRGANDYRSMAAGNTSAFNCREVVNRPGVRSPHATGRSLDLNTWENPYRSPTGLVPNTWWQAHADPRYAWRSRSHAVVRILLRRGFRWTYGLSDTQHFDVVGGSGKRAALLGACRDAVCD